MSNNLFELLKQLPDARRKQAQVHSLPVILMIIIMATMSGYYGERAKGDFVEKNRKDLLKIFKPKDDKLPSYQTIDRALDNLDFDSLILVFLEWTKTLKGDEDNLKTKARADKTKTKTKTNLTKEWLHVDGKAIKGTVNNCNTKEQKFINLVSAFSHQRKQVLGFNLVENDKESEIPKVRELIQMLGLKGVVFTADALHCQKETTKVIVESKNDYVLQVKGNQKRLNQQLKKTVKSSQ